MDCQRALGQRLGPPAFPRPGSALGEFQLLSELGRGAHGRVYLASQGSLGGRPVVLKLGPDTGGEHLSLARLQHTHIVPLYSAHEFPDRRLRALCMPYFGGATLADIRVRLDRLGRPPVGDDLLATVRPTPEPDASSTVPGPAWAFLERATLTEAVCWIGTRLADALQYAHDRGLLHLDLKPANVLLAADGVPMLLDFHLARPPMRGGDPAPDWLGGTPGYMAPEHEAALRAARDGRPVPADVDARADIHSLGVLLREMLDGPGAPRGRPASTTSWPAPPRRPPRPAIRPRRCWRPTCGGTSPICRSRASATGVSSSGGGSGVGGGPTRSRSFSPWRPSRPARPAWPPTPAAWRTAPGRRCGTGRPTRCGAGTSRRRRRSTAARP